MPDGQAIIAYLEGEGEYAARDKFPYPKLLVLDLRMHPVSGFDVLHWLRAHPAYKTFPILIVTGTDDRQDIQEAYQLGISTFITKPITRAKLKEACDAMNIQPSARLFYSSNLEVLASTANHAFSTSEGESD